MRAKEREPSSLITAGPKSVEDHFGRISPAAIAMTTAANAEAPNGKRK
jgi:hypothetical protein